MDELKQWTREDYLESKKIEQDKLMKAPLKGMVNWSSAVANPQRGWSTNE